MAAPIARGPLAFMLQSQTGQWMTISLGALYAFPEQAKMFVGNYAGPIAKALTGIDLPTLEDGTARAQVVATPAPATPIIIHTTSGDGKNQYVGFAVKVIIGGTACWVGYFALTNALPDYVQEFFPVTRKFFAKTSKFLASAIEQVKDTLEEQIRIVTGKQDELSDKLDDTHESVLGLHRELGDARSELNNMNTSMARQESTLNASHRTQSYTSRGVTLLVRCVASMLPTNDRTVNDLAEYIKDGEEIRKHEEKRRLEESISNAVSKKPISMISSRAPQQPPQNNLLIRTSSKDSDMDSLEDVHAVLGIPSSRGGFLSSTMRA